MFSKINNFVKNVTAGIRGIVWILASDFQEPIVIQSNQRWQTRLQLRRTLPYANIKSLPVEKQNSLCTPTPSRQNKIGERGGDGCTQTTHKKSLFDSPLKLRTPPPCGHDICGQRCPFTKASTSWVKLVAFPNNSHILRTQEHVIKVRHTPNIVPLEITVWARAKTYLIALEAFLKIEAASRVGLTGPSSRSNEALDLIGNKVF